MHQKRLETVKYLMMQIRTLPISVDTAKDFIMIKMMLAVTLGSMRIVLGLLEWMSLPVMNVLMITSKMRIEHGSTFPIKL